MEGKSSVPAENLQSNKPENQRAKPLFPIGNLTCTSGAWEALEAANQHPRELLYRHVTGDWGDLSEEDCVQNNLAVEQGLEIASAYALETGAIVWVITTADRRTTTLITVEFVGESE